MVGRLGGLLYPLAYLLVWTYPQVYLHLATWQWQLPVEVLALSTTYRKRCVKCMVCLDNVGVFFTVTSLLYSIAPKLPKKASWKKIHLYHTSRVCLDTKCICKFLYIQRNWFMFLYKTQIRFCWNIKILWEILGRTIQVARIILKM